MTDERIRRLQARLRQDLGAHVLDALSQPTTLEVMVNGREAFVDSVGKGMLPLGVAVDPASSAAFMRTLSGYYDRVITDDSPVLECQLPWDGSRFTGALPPIVPLPIFTIRKRAASRIRLQDYVKNGSLSEPLAASLRSAVLQRKNVLVAGGTGSGKTTLVNALIAEINDNFSDERPVVIEDTPEIQCSAENKVHLYTSSHLDMSALVRLSLRLRPDRIIVGEVRGPEALDLVMAWNTGHGGGAGTIHADSAKDTFLRLQSLVSMHPRAPRAHVEEMIRKAINVVVYITRTRQGRQVTDVLWTSEE